MCTRTSSASNTRHCRRRSRFRQMRGQHRRAFTAWWFRMTAASYCATATPSAKSATTSKWSRFCPPKPRRRRRPPSRRRCCKFSHPPFKCHRRRATWRSHGHRQRYRRWSWDRPRSRSWWGSDRCTCSRSNWPSASRVRDAVATTRNARTCDDTSVSSADKSHASHVPYAICASNETTRWITTYWPSTASKMPLPTWAQWSTFKIEQYQSFWEKTKNPFLSSISADLTPK